MLDHFAWTGFASRQGQFNSWQFLWSGSLDSYCCSIWLEFVDGHAGSDSGHLWADIGRTWVPQVDYGCSWFICWFYVPLIPLLMAAIRSILKEIPWRTCRNVVMGKRQCWFRRKPCADCLILIYWMILNAFWHFLASTMLVQGGTCPDMCHRSLRNFISCWNHPRMYTTLSTLTVIRNASPLILLGAERLIFGVPICPHHKRHHHLFGNYFARQMGSSGPCWGRLLLNLPENCCIVRCRDLLLRWHLFPGRLEMPGACLLLDVVYVLFLLFLVWGA